MKKKCLTTILVFCLTGFGFGQTVTPSVINSAGGSATVSGISIDYNIGETCVTTLTNGAVMLTQGFLQPERLGLAAVAFPTDVTCVDQLDGSIIITATVTGAPAGTVFDYEYHWSPPALCPNSALNCSMVTNLPPGNYSVEIIATYASGPSAPNDTTMLTNIIINPSSEPCILEIFNGMTPNGDGINDVFYIKNIDLFPGNIVYIYNRWGLKLDEIHDYDNKVHVWKGNVKGGSSDIAPSGTYYYIIDLNNGKEMKKGWLELTHK